MASYCNIGAKLCFFFGFERSSAKLMHLNEALVLPDLQGRGEGREVSLKKKTGYPFSDFGKF